MSEKIISWDSACTLFRRGELFHPLVVEKDTNLWEPSCLDKDGNKIRIIPRLRGNHQPAQYKLMVWAINLFVTIGFPAKEIKVLMKGSPDDIRILRYGETVTLTRMELIDNPEVINYKNHFSVQARFVPDGRKVMFCPRYTEKSNNEPNIYKFSGNAVNFLKGIGFEKDAISLNL